MPRLDFLGKSEVANLHLAAPYRILEVDKRRSEGDGTLDGNLIIQGDNLHALKALLPHYEGRINCIYIDPPYNTGHEGWVYNDKLNSPLHKEWLGKVVGIDDQCRHDKWLCMMWPRLQLLKELLAEDGVIFVSIDDNEEHHLRNIMNEIFGEENFVESFIWRSRLGRGATSKNTAKLHEYIIAYAKEVTAAHFRMSQRTRETQETERLRQWGQGDRREDRPTLFYPIRSKEFGDIYPIRPDGTQGRWRVSQSKMEELRALGLVVFKKQTDNRVEAYRIIPAGTKTHIAYPSMLESQIVKTTAHGSIELRDILGADKFSYPKPSLLVKEIISLCTKNDAIILDSFAGSGTTAQAVLALNKEDGGSRKFILVECEEEIAPKVTAQRVRRVIKGVKGAKDEVLRGGLGGSFTYCTLGEAIEEEKMLSGDSMPSWENLARYVFYLATGTTLSRTPKENKKGFVGKTENLRIYLLYKDDLAFMRGHGSALDVDRAEALLKDRQPGETLIVYAAAAYLSHQDLKTRRIRFCQLPYALEHSL